MVESIQEFVKDKKEYLPLLVETIAEWEEKNMAGVVLSDQC